MSVRYERKGRTITTITTDDETRKVTRTQKGYQHENEAKRASAIIQKANGGIGCGALRLVN